MKMMEQIKMLNKIIENKNEEVDENKKIFPLNSFKSKIKPSSRNFKEALSKNKISKNKITLIAEIKRKSPSQEFFPDKKFDIKNIARVYSKYADAISVLTDKKFFNGTLEDMKKVSTLTKLPILRKDFIIDEYQIYESRLSGADAVLLIASILSSKRIDDFISTAKKFSMDCLVEINNEDDLGKVLCSRADIIGINNRNLNTLKIDTNTTLRLMDKIPDNKIIVSESGINSREYVEKIKHKVDAILVGGLFMNSNNPEKEILSLIK